MPADTTLRAVILLKELTKKFASFVDVDNLSQQEEEGEIFG